MIQRGDHWIIFPHFLTRRPPKILLLFYLFITSSPLTRFIHPTEKVVFLYTNTFWPCSCITSTKSIFWSLLLSILSQPQLNSTKSYVWHKNETSQEQQPPSLGAYWLTLFLSFCNISYCKYISEKCLAKDAVKNRGCSWQGRKLTST